MAIYTTRKNNCLSLTVPFKSPKSSIKTHTFDDDDDVYTHKHHTQVSYKRKENKIKGREHSHLLERARERETLSP